LSRNTFGAALFEQLNASSTRLWRLKVEIRSAIQSGDYDTSLSSKEYELLCGNPQSSRIVRRRIPLPDNAKRTFRLAAKVFGTNFRPNVTGKQFRDFIAAAGASEKPYAPRTFCDIYVTDGELRLHIAAGKWG